MCANGVAWFACVLLGSVQGAIIDPGELLDRMEKARGYQREYVTRVECSVEAEAPATSSQTTPKPTRSQNVLELRYDGTRFDPNKLERIDLLTYPWSAAPDANDAVAKDYSHLQRAIWDGSRLYSGLSFRDANMTVLVDRYVGITKGHPQPRMLLTRDYGASGLEGYVYGDSLSLVEVLKEQDSLRVRKEMEKVQVVPCHVLEASGIHGNYTVWLDPTHGYNVARVSARKAAGHWYFDSVLAKTPGKRQMVWITETSYDMNDVRFELIDGVWIPMEASWTVTTKYANIPRGAAARRPAPDSIVSVRRFHARRLSIDLKPDFAALRAFVPTIPDGTEIKVSGANGLPYVWRHGDYVPDVNERVVARIDGFMEKARAASAPAPGSVDAAAGTSPETVFADDSPGPAGTEGRGTTGPQNLCGIYSLYSASRFLGKPVEMGFLFKPEYVGSFRGSSLRELVTGAKVLGLHAEPLMHMNRRMLQRCPNPVILYVKGENGLYSHWILYLGSRGDKILVFDAPKPPEWISPGALAASWAGLGLIVSPEPIDSRAIIGPSRAYLGGGIAVLVVVLLALRRVVLRWPARVIGFGLGPWRRSWIQVATVCLIAGIVSLAQAALHPEGLLAGADGTRYIQEVQLARFIPKVGVRDVEAMTAAGAVVIDARLVDDFKMGHIQGAISIPVDANDAICQARSAEIPKGRKIILYCQSSKCQFAEKIAKWLMNRGYSDVAIFRGGWIEWQRHHPQVTKERSV